MSSAKAAEIKAKTANLVDDNRVKKDEYDELQEENAKLVKKMTKI
jgi:hypothetical protein